MTEVDVQELVTAFRTFTKHPSYRSALHVSSLVCKPCHVLCKAMRDICFYTTVINKTGRTSSA